MALSSASLRLQVEHILRHRVPGALSPQPRAEFPRLPTGVAQVDELLGGGFPLGAISELFGPPSSGRTSLALAFTSQTTLSGRVATWIDVGDMFDPESAAAAGVDLDRLLWVRCGDAHSQTRAGAKPCSVSVASGLLCGKSRMPSPSGGGGSPHPRGESRGMPEAIHDFLQNQRWSTAENSGAPGMNAENVGTNPLTQSSGDAGEARRAGGKPGTPGVPNRPLSRVLSREAQAPTDRMPSRRPAALHLEPRHPSATVPHGAEAPPKRPEALQHRPFSTPELQVGAVPKHLRSPARKQTWLALDQALRAADLLLSAGGFAALVLDLGSTPPEMAWRIPLATWFRFRAAAERSRTAVVLLTQHPCARSSAEIVLRLGALQAQSESTVLTGVLCEAAVSRQRFELAEATAAERVIPIRKPPRSERRAQWVSTAAWKGGAP